MRKQLLHLLPYFRGAGDCSRLMGSRTPDASVNIFVGRNRRRACCSLNRKNERARANSLKFISRFVVAFRMSATRRILWATCL